MSCLCRCHLRSRRQRCLALLLLGMLVAVGAGLRAWAQTPADWKTVKVPDTWKNPLPGIDNFSWYRGFVRTPAGWKDKDLELFVEPSDVAHEVYFNGRRVGGAGEFPPFFRSGLGGADRFFVAADAVRQDAPNVVAIRVYNLEGRTGFNVAAPVLFGEQSAIRMAGDWQFRAGDNAAYARFDGDQPPPGCDAVLEA